MKTKYQAHGSPGNLIDLYASADIQNVKPLDLCPTILMVLEELKGTLEQEMLISP